MPEHKQIPHYWDSIEYEPSKVVCIVTDQTFLIRVPSFSGQDPTIEWIKESVQSYQQSGCSQTKITGGINLRLSRLFLKDKSLNVAILAKYIFHIRYTEMTAYGGIKVRTQFREYGDSRRVGINVSWKFNATRSRYKGSHAVQAERNRL